MAGGVDDLTEPGPERRMVAIFATPIEPEAGLRPPDEDTLRHLADRSREGPANSRYLAEPRPCEFGGQKLWKVDIETTYPDHKRYSKTVAVAGPAVVHSDTVQRAKAL